MANVPSPDIDDDFSDIYKEYTGPPRSTVTNVAEKGRVNKTLQAGSDEEEEARDPNAVPTDFTSREAKVWEAKSKATERNWKKRKEEEMICKICGESGHFTQGCPSTLGANRKSQDFFERVPARDKHVKALFSEKVIHKIESDIGCKLKMEEKFLIVSAKNSSIMEKGVDAVRKVIKEGEKGDRGGSSSQRSRSRSPDRARVGAHLGRSDSQRSHSSPWNSSQFHQRINRQEKVNEDHFREDLQQLSRASQARAYGNDGARSRSSHSKSPARPTFSRNAFNSYEDHSRSVGSHKIDELDVNKRGSDMSSGHKYEYSTYPQTLEELELQYKREAMELGKIRDKEEDEENYKHRETVSVMREDYMKKLAIQRGMQSKHWEEFLQLDHQRRQQAREHLPSAGFTATGYNNPGYNDFDRTSSNPHYEGAGAPVDSRGRYLYPAENISAARSHENYGEFQRQRHEGYGKAYNRY
ncbi:hypothetical protein Syun_016686 [Stephania yunnanensis]|uniref:CCHC-type domain-containing protein n=1 Tax=Stephania yunnanensis TaxID=152371 RepID=A0AAP0J5J6_9MAGN